MSQAKLSEFFQTRKRKGDFQPSKRRKVVRNENYEITTEVAPTETSTPPISSRTRRRAAPQSETTQISSKTVGEISSSKAAAPSVKATQKTSQYSKTQTRKVKGRSRKDKSQQNIFDAFSKVPSESSDSDTHSIEEDGKSETFSLATASCDDHSVSPPSAPTKISSREKGNTEVVSEKRSKHSETQRIDLLEESGFRTPEKTVEGDKSTTRKKLILKKQSPSKSPVFEFKGRELDPSENSPKLLRIEKETSTESTASTVPTLSLVKAVAEPQPTRATVQDANPVEMKKKLAKCGKLSELKAKLAQFSEAKAGLGKRDKELQNQAVKSSGEPPAEAETRKKSTPAYQRFHSLASPLPPSLTLPFKYKVLFEIFQSTDTVVSMLHKRSEICTFSKLQAAVQQMRKKAFELLHLGQIKSVYPSAYIMRQEKGLPEYGKGHNSNYQLTVEANLDDHQPEVNENATTGSASHFDKTAFSVNLLLQRKDIFFRNLVMMVKEHHKIFLASLARPLSISDDKITRWHPKFPLDTVPDVPAAELPQAPNVKKFSSAKDVLDQVNLVSKFNPKIQEALRKVASMEKRKEEKEVDQGPSKPSISTSTPASVKGIPQSMLERIRAKEQEKLESSMMRTSADEKRQSMMSRLPELTRILRTVFVTEKKPALMLEEVVQKMSDSYKSNLGSVEAEKHIMMIAKVLPDWLTVVTVKKGRFLKLDKNKDMAVINKRIDELIRKS